MKRKHRSYTRRVAWVPSALCGLALPAAAAPRGHVHHGTKQAGGVGLPAAAAPTPALLAWRVRFTPASLPVKDSPVAKRVVPPVIKEAAPRVSLAENMLTTGVSQVVPSYEMQRARRSINASSVMRTTSPSPAARSVQAYTAPVVAPRLVAAPKAAAAPKPVAAAPVRIAEAPRPTTPVAAAPVVTVPAAAAPVVKTVVSAKIEPTAPAIAKALPTKPVAETRLAVAPVPAKATEPTLAERGPADLSARHKDRLLLAQLEADLNRSETSLTRATKDLTEGQRQLASFGDTLRAAMMEAGPDAKGLHPFVKVAQRYAGTPYVWGGESARGFDCSGFIIRVMRDLGYKALPHSAAEQFRYGLPIANALLKPGDLVFFANTYKPGISHVGIYLGRRRFIHAAGTGLGTIVSSLDAPKFRAKYAGGRRLVTQ